MLNIHISGVMVSQFVLKKSPAIPETTVFGY